MRRNLQYKQQWLRSNQYDQTIYKLRKPSFIIDDDLLKWEPLITKYLKMIDKEYPIHHDIHFIAWNGSNHTHGQTRFIDIYHYSIALNLNVTKPSSMMNTIIHEILHTYPTVFYDGHLGEWKKRAEYINYQYPELNLKRTTDEYIEVTKNTKQTNKRKYTIECVNCHAPFGRDRLAAFLLPTPGTNRARGAYCPRCQGDLLVTQNY